MPGDDAIKDLGAKAAREGKELAKDGAAVGRLIGTAGADLSAWWRLIKRWLGRIIKVQLALALIFLQLLAAGSTANAECGTGTNDPSLGPSYATTSSTAGVDMTIVKLVYEAVKKRYGNNPDGNRVLLASFEVALTESNFNNISYGDRDSLGVFQQRASWGSAAQRTNPTWATNKFLNALETFRKSHPNYPAHKLAQATQRSACQGNAMPAWCNGVYGGNYLQKENQAKQLIEKAGGFFESTGTTGTMNVDPNATTVVDASTSGCDVSLSSGTTVKIGQKGVHVSSATISRSGVKSTNKFVIDIPVGQRGKVIAAAMTQLGVPYLWGGTTWAGAPGAKGGLDCSGLTLNAVKRGAGITIPRVANAQYFAMKPKGTGTAKAQPGDLIFWSKGSPQGIHHVAIYLGMGTMNGGKPQPLILEAPHTGDLVKINVLWKDPSMFWGNPGYTDDATATT